MGKQPRRPFSGTSLADRPQPYSYIVNFRIQAIDALVPCQASFHRGIPAAMWDVRSYEDTVKAARLIKAGISEIDATICIREETIREQARRGIHLHLNTKLCTDCLLAFFDNHMMQEKLSEAMAIEESRRGVFLIVTHRKTAMCYLAFDFPPEIKERDMLLVLETEPRYTTECKSE